MKYKIAFFAKHFTERGTDKTTYDYADFNESILKNESIIICFSDLILQKKGLAKNNDKVKKKYQERFKLIEILQIEDLETIIKKYKITHFFVQSHGFHRDIFKFNNKKIWGNCVTIYQCAFGPMARQSSKKRLVVGDYLNKRYKKEIPVLSPIVRKHKYLGNLRDKYNIPFHAEVIGRHGGKDTFDINFVKDAIIEVVQNNKNIYFLFLNTRRFSNHKNIIFINTFLNDKELNAFIDTCDAMIHGRKDGETFGLAPAEFSAANKPVITFNLSKDREHIKILNEKAILYQDKEDLINIFKNFSNIKNSRIDWNGYRDYEPENVMKKFKRLCLIPQKDSLLKKLKVFFVDLPWEIRIISSLLLAYAKSIKRKCLSCFLPI